MALSVHEFWHLLVASGLHDEEDCRRLADAYAKARETGAIARTVPLPEWMLNSGAMTRYQAKILLAGKSGPFVYGDYLVTDRMEVAGQPGLFRAIHRPTKIPVTLYFLSGALTDPDVVDQLRREAATAAALSRHAHYGAYLIHCHTLVELESYKFLVLEELPTATLADRLAGGKSLPPKEALRIACDVMSGLVPFGDAHTGHGAVRPARVWLTADGRARLPTFPLARDPLAVIGAHVTFDIDEAAVNYCPPECVTGEAPNMESDIYSLGCVFYEMLAGNAPFPTGDREHRLKQHCQEVPLPLDKVNPAIPKPLAALVPRMLAKKPEDRKTCVAVLLKQLEKNFEPLPSPPARARLDDWLAANGAGHATSSSGVNIGVPTIFSPSESGTSARAFKRNPTRRNRVPLIVACVSVLLLVIGGGAYFLTGMRAPQKIVALSPAMPERAPSTATPVTDDVTAVNDETDSQAGSAAEPSDAAVMAQPNESNPATTTDPIVAVDGTMWVSPTQGAPLDLKYLAPGAEVIVALRPAQFADQPEAEKLLDPRTLGPFAEFVATALPTLAGTPLSGIDAVLIGILDGSNGAPRPSVVISLREPPESIETLLKAWGDPSAVENDGITIYKKGDLGFWFPDADTPGKTIVIGPAELIKDEVIPAGENPPALSREMEDLAALSDRDRDITILASPGILHTGSTDWFPGIGSRLRAPLDWFLSGHEADGETPAKDLAPATSTAGARSIDMSTHGLPQAALVSAHLSGDDLFLELRASTPLNTPTANLARSFRERMARLPKRVSEYIRTLDLSDYSRDVLFDFPLMVEQLGRYTVVGTQGRQVVLRAYLPSVAAHNLALGSRLALAERLRSGAAGSARSATKAAAPEPLAKRLDRKISLVFDRATLEKALQMVGEEIGAEVLIRGADLQLEGITKNQSFGLDEKEQSAREILRKVMIRANPDGKLIYVVGPSSGGGGETLIITTRAAARQRGEAVPAELAEQP
ncbi:MAG TPA: serine/threonine-protein kinase [Pirellulales bacterium]|jgi:hypothetical protein